MQPKTLMIIGMGDLAGLTLDLICREPGIGRIILAGRNLQHMRERSNLARLVANQLGHYPEFEVVELDLDNPDQTAATLHRCKPDVIYSTASLQSWRMITYLPKEVFKELDEAQFGPWLPMHLSPVFKLMQAVRDAGISPLVVNAAFPDAVGCVLQSRDLASTTGIGNAANVIPALRGAIALQRGCDVREIEVALFTQHYFSHRIPAVGDSGGAPYHLSAWHKGEDISEQLDHDALLMSVKTDFKKTGGALRQQVTAASAASILLPMLQDKPTLAHAAGACGLPGGYRVRVDGSGVELALPENLSREQAIALNHACQQFDGIESIDEHGTVTFTEREMAIMQQMLGYTCRMMKLDDVHAQAQELGAKYAAFCGQFV